MSTKVLSNQRVTVLAGLASGVYAGTEEISHLWRAERRFLPTLDRERAEGLMQQWEHAVRQTTAL